MTETERFVHRAERDLRGAKALSEASLDAWDGLPPGHRAAFEQALGFLGQAASGTVQAAGTPPEADRVAASRLMLLKLGLPEGEPCWSSFLLGSMVDSVLATPGGGLGDLFTALYELLGECELSEVLANFLKELVVLCFTAHRPSYDAIPWAGLLGGDARGLTRARGYFLVLALPQEFFSAELAEAVSKALEAPPWAVPTDTLIS